MKNKNAVFVLIVLFVLMIGGAYVLYDRLGDDVTAEQLVVQAAPKQDGVLSGEKPDQESEPDTNEEPEIIYAPDFHVYDKDGKTVHLSDYFGKPIVLNYWASWCEPCRSEMPEFNEKYAELGDDVHFVMVNMTDGGRETVQKASDFIDENGYDFPVLFDITGEAADAYGAYSLPTSFFIDENGHVVAQAVGAIDADTLQMGIDLIVSGRN